MLRAYKALPGKIDLSFGLCKKTKLMLKIILFTRHVLSSLYGTEKPFVFREIVQTHTRY
jgi:hypothetical protein